MDFVLDDNNPLLKQYYSNDNYKDIVLRGGGRKNCIIFFSGNGLYFPNNRETFENVVVEQNRYEWENQAESEEIREWADRIIFIRDIYKSWYVKGINDQIDTINAIIKWLSKITQGWDVVTCGNSSGGYMAALIGSKIGARCAFSFGGQWNLSYAFSENILIRERYSEDREYIDLVGLLKENRVPIFWFYSAKCEGDLEQYRFFRNDELPYVYDFAMDSAYHGHLLLGGCYRKLLPLDEIRVIKIYEKYRGKMINMRLFCLELMSWKEALPYWKKDIINNHKSLQIILSKVKRHGK